jgi:hypothetical protein
MPNKYTYATGQTPQNNDRVRGGTPKDRYSATVVDSRGQGDRYVTIDRDDKPYRREMAERQTLRRIGRATAKYE